eukprot:UN07743
MGLLNHTSFAVEDIFIPAIPKIEQQLRNGDIQVVFIIGHARSGTTALHTALRLLTDYITTSIMFDFSVTSILNKIINYPFKPIIAAVSTT